MTTFFTSDTHFGHPWVIRVYGRPFESVAAMDEALVAAWNSAVGPEDEVWHLGDVAVGRTVEYVASRVARLNGRKHLIRGNNDPDPVAALPDWESVAAYAEIVVEGVPLVLCHYPFRSWNGQYKGAWDLHGHSHGRLKNPLPRQADVGVDAWGPRLGYRPVTLAEIRERSPRRAGRASPKL